MMPIETLRNMNEQTPEFYGIFWGQRESVFKFKIFLEDPNCST